MKNILIVDDEPDILKILKIRLESQLYAIKTASNGEEAVKSVKTAAPDLIIMDIMMPVMDGMKACAYIKADKRFYHIPIIMLTADADPLDRATCQKIGANSFCQKPLNMEDLFAQVSSLLRT